MQLYFTREHQGTGNVRRDDAMMMERSGCLTGDWKGGHDERPQKRVSDWNSNLGGRD